MTGEIRKGGALRISRGGEERIDADQEGKSSGQASLNSSPVIRMESKLSEQPVGNIEPHISSGNQEGPV